MATEKQVPTIAGFFGATRIESLRETLAAADGDVTVFEGNELLVSFGKYLLEYVEGEYSRRNNSGL